MDRLHDLRARMALLLSVILAAIAPATGGGTQIPVPAKMIGTWRLSDIEFSGQHGRMPDPFYGAHPVGLIVYDSTGHVSVQISRPHAYYAYFGTWTYDPAAASVTHHVESSLLPAEIGVDYVQQVSIEGDRLIFTNRDANDGKPTLRIKIWRRVTGPER